MAKATAKAKTQSIELREIHPTPLTVFIEGDGDLVLNKMNDVNARRMINERKDKAKELEKVNVWEEILTAIHWQKELPKEGREQWDKSYMEKQLTDNVPCITSFGLKKSWMDAVVRNGIDTYSTKFNAAVNIVANNGLVPVKFSEWSCDERLMSPKKGKPVLVHLNRFSGWSATIHLNIMETVYSAEQIVNIINLAGFGIGIGSGRSSGFGRYHVTSIQ